MYEVAIHFVHPYCTPSAVRCSIGLHRRLPAANLTGMRPIALITLLALVPLASAADSAIKGNFTGDWSGASGAGGTFKLSVEDDGGKSKCTVSFAYAGEEVKTNVTLCKIDGSKIEAQYEFDLGGNSLQSTIHGELKENALTGKYQTKALADGSAVDAGDWKAASTK